MYNHPCDNDYEGRTSPVVLSIAGSDCSGGAGVQADVKTCNVLGVHCLTAITAITAQNHHGVLAIEYVGDAMLEKQLQACVEYATPDAVKIGLLPSVNAILIVEKFLKERRFIHVVIDPVLKATAGNHSFSENADEFAATLKNRLFPLAELVTPNLPELLSLSHIANDCRHALASEDEIDSLAIKVLMESGADYLLAKGGHREGAQCIDSLYERAKGKKMAQFVSERIDTPHSHGTGCTLSSAIATYLAQGFTMKEAIGMAKRKLTEWLEAGANYPIVIEGGPLNVGIRD